MSPKHLIAQDIRNFFAKVLELKQAGNYKYAGYTDVWLKKLGLSKNYARESAAARTTKCLQQFLKDKYGSRVNVEAQVGENMSLRFSAEDGQNGDSGAKNTEIDFKKFQAFDILDLETNTAFEISLSDAFAEFFKDLLKSLLDSRVKTLYFCARNHKYLGSKKSGFIKVRDSSMVHQYIALAKLYKLDVVLFDLFPQCNG
ncbi:hypothetical protein FJZ40_03270 [Candidatus Shapirobacteria bacterium]|nr:hypothetical protein [Candidatus Shapirobacteria bacterium]